MSHVCSASMMAPRVRQPVNARMAAPSRLAAQLRPVARRPTRCQRSRKQQQLVCASAAASSLAEAQALPLVGADGQATAFPAVAAVYGILDSQGTLQYVGLTRKLNLSVATHKEALPELVHSVKWVEVPGGERDALTEKWKEWVSESVNETGNIPPGNAPGETRWQAKRPRAKPEIRLTPGKGLQDLTCSVEDLIDAVVKTNKVVAFVKGTRTSPSCGFSYKTLTILNESGIDYEVVDVLDETYNPGVREAIKTYTQWPTIPQVFVKGEFVGGADILEQMHASGELREMLT